LFSILFAWQHPHFFAIAWMCRDDYRAAGLKMLPVVEPSGHRMFRQTIAFSILLLCVSLLPTVIGMTGAFYFWGALLLVISILAVSARFTRDRNRSDALRLLKASVLYLPLLLLLIIVDAHR